MTEPFYRVDENGSKAWVRADFSVVECLLQDQGNWAAEVLRLSGFPRLYWQAAVVKSRLFPARIIPGGRSWFVASGAAGRYFSLVYLIQRQNDGWIEVTPSPYLPLFTQLGLMLLLCLFHVWPVLLAPLVWSGIRSRNMFFSCTCLKAFCQYLQQQLSPSETEGLQGLESVQVSTRFETGAAMSQDAQSCGAGRF